MAQTDLPQPWYPPSLDDFERLAVQAWSSLPPEFQNMCGHLEVFVADFADKDTLRELKLKDPFELTGVYIGTDLTRKSHTEPVQEPDRVFLYRRPILDEWADRGDIPLAELVAHVLVHLFRLAVGGLDRDLSHRGPTAGR